jgi:cell volume regulation protein A
MLVPIVFAAVGFVILLGFVGSYFFRKTMVPDILWLLILGMILGPVFNVVDPAIFADFTPFFVAIAIMIILFQGGIHTNIYTLIRQSPRSTLLAVLGILFSMVVCGVFAFYMLEWPLMNGLLLGAILGGSSSPIVISITQRLPIGDNIKTLLNIESTLTDAFCIIVSLVLIEIMAFGAYSATDIASSLIGSFSIGATMGMVVGMVWIAGLSKLRRHEFEYILILGILLLLYAFVESINGSGAIAAFVFGVVIANSREISSMIKMKKETIMHSEVTRFHNEVSFLVRTFFFVYLGLIVTFASLNIILISLALTSILMIVRFASVHISTAGMGFPNNTNNTKALMGLLMPRGLAAAVLTQVPLMYAIPHAESYPGIVVGVVFMSILFTSVAIMLMKNRIASIKPVKTRRKRKK